MENFQCSQGIFRRPLTSGPGGEADLRLISAGLAPFIKLNLEQEVTAQGVAEADDFWSDFHADARAPYHKPYPWPREMFRRIIDRHGGHYPIVVTGLRDGQAHYVGEPHVQVWTDEPGMGECVGWVESTLLPYLWTSSIVATRGRLRKERMMQVYRDCYQSRSEAEIHAMVSYKFHDFGRRGGAASQITGIAHLLNWLGTDTCDAAYAATKFLNAGRKFGACSIVAAAHRSITPWPAEIDAYRHLIEKYKDGLVSVVADSYNYHRGMEMLAGFAEVVKLHGGCLVGRPDSGDPVQCILDGLEIFSRAFGVTRQERGLRILNNAAIIQGDGVSDDVIFEKIYPAVIAAGFDFAPLAGAGLDFADNARPQFGHQRALGRGIAVERQILPLAPGGDDGGAFARQHVLENPAFLAIAVADAPPIVELGDDLDWHGLALEHPGDGMIAGGTFPHIHLLGLERHEAGDRKTRGAEGLGTVADGGGHVIAARLGGPGGERFGLLAENRPAHATCHGDAGERQYDRANPVAIRPNLAHDPFSPLGLALGPLCRTQGVVYTTLNPVQRIER
jgi:hypothetical protein